jgi:hypothetical protein
MRFLVSMTLSAGIIYFFRVVAFFLQPEAGASVGVGVGKVRVADGAAGSTSIT